MKEFENDSIFNKLKEYNNWQERLMEFANPMKGMQDSLKHSDYVNAHIKQFINPLKSFNSIYEEMTKTSIRMNRVLGVDSVPFAGSTVYDSFALKQENLFKTTASSLSGMSIAMSETINRYSNIYEKQLLLSEKITNSFASAFSFDKISNSIFNPDNYINKTKLTAFDFISGSTFINTFRGFERDEQEISDTYNEIEFLLKDKIGLQDEIIKLQATVITLQKGENKGNENWYNLEVTYYLEWFLNKILIRKLKMNRKTATITLWIALACIYFFKDIFYETKGSAIGNAIIGNEEEQPKDTILKYIEIPKEINDFTITKTPIYIRKSIKSKRIGNFPVSSTVIIIKIVEGWCFVEGKVTIIKKNNRKNRKKAEGKKVERTLKGWVQKKNLDMFQ